MKIEVDATDVNKYETDDRGRLTLGVDYRDATVTVAIVDVE